MKPVYGDEAWICYIDRDLSEMYDDLYPLRRGPFAGWRVRATSAVRQELWP